MKLSVKQREWLEHLRDHGPAKSGSVTGFFCRKNGLTVFLMRNKQTGEGRPHTEFEKPWTQELLADWAFGDVEAITDKGRAALEEQENG